MTPSRLRLLIGAASGIAAAAISVGIGELVAAFVRPASSPIIVVGNRVILLTPEGLRRWAIREFGTNDKPALLTGIYLGIAAVAAAVGVLTVRNRRAGLLAFGAIGLFGVYCALTTHAHRDADVVPSIVGTVAGAITLAALVRPLRSGAGSPEQGLAPASLRPARREILRGLSLAAVGAAFAGVLGRSLQRTRYDASAARRATTLPAVAGPTPVTTGYDFGKSGVPFAVGNDRFYRIDTALSVPQLNPATWRLRIHGMVDREITLSYPELIARPQVQRWITLACVSNEVGGDLVGNALFQGVLLADLLREAGVSPEADQLLATSSDGMTIGSPTAVVMDGRDSMLAVGMNSEPLPIDHGFPVRMVVPGLYGYVSACKWIVDIEATTFAAQSAYWVAEGWAQQAQVLLASRIDTPKPSATLSAGATLTVAGVAWDQHVGVSKVEVQLDDGPWQPARLAPVPSTDTWRQWLIALTVPPAGVHSLRVRATDAKGRLQTGHRVEPFPSGATGWHTVSFRSR